MYVCDRVSFPSVTNSALLLSGGKKGESGVVYSDQKIESLSVFVNI